MVFLSILPGIIAWLALAQRADAGNGAVSDATPYST